MDSAYLTNIFADPDLSLITFGSQNKHLREIAWIQSHEVRGPVSSILGLTSLLDAEGEKDPQNAETVKLIEKGAEALDAVIKEIIFQKIQVHSGGKHDGQLIVFFVAIDFFEARKVRRFPHSLYYASTSLTLSCSVIN